MVDDLWRLYNDGIASCVQAGKMKAVLFQFNLKFAPSDEARKYVEHCRHCLDKRVAMAVEFRNRAWVSPTQRAATLAWMTRNRLIFVMVV